MLTKLCQQMLTKIDRQLFHTIETDGRLAGANQQMFLTYTIDLATSRLTDFFVCFGIGSHITTLGGLVSDQTSTGTSKRIFSFDSYRNAKRSHRFRHVRTGSTTSHSAAVACRTLSVHES